MPNVEDYVIAGIIAIIAAILFIQPIRTVVFGLSAIASFFAMIASIIHFQILAAMGFLILGIILIGIASIGQD